MEKYFKSSTISINKKNKEVKMPRLQTYVDETTMEKIKNLADENHMPVSKFVSKPVSDSLSQKSFFEKKTHQLLGQILCCVYDADIQKTNYSVLKISFKI